MRDIVDGWSDDKRDTKKKVGTNIRLYNSVEHKHSFIVRTILGTEEPITSGINVGWYIGQLGIK